MKMIVDRIRHIVIKDQIKINDLTRKEFQILWQLCEEPGRVYTREQIFKKVWDGDNRPGSERTVDVHIVQLRRKINKALIKSIKGVGYKILMDNEEIELIK